jgi:hypothetical protein
MSSNLLPCHTLLAFTTVSTGKWKNIKVVPSNISSILTPRVLAYWIGGDGTFEKSGGVTILCTDSFTVNEVELLRSISLDK